MSRKIADETDGLSILQIEALWYVKEEKEVLMKDLASHLFIAPPSATSLADDLVKAKLVKRSEDKKDRRTTAISLTPKGEAGACEFFEKKNGKNQKEDRQADSSGKKIPACNFGKTGQRERSIEIIIVSGNIYEKFCEIKPAGTHDRRHRWRLIGISIWAAFHFTRIPAFSETQIFEVQKGTIENEISADITLKPAVDTDLAFENSGKIKNIYVSVGDQGEKRPIARGRSEQRLCRFFAGSGSGAQTRLKLILRELKKMLISREPNSRVSKTRMRKNTM